MGERSRGNNFCGIPPFNQRLIVASVILAVWRSLEPPARSIVFAADLLDRVATFGEFAQEQGGLSGPWPFPSDPSRFACFHDRSNEPERLVYDDTKQEVVLMSGLPGAGKDTWVRENMPGLPMVSLDQICQDLQVAPDDDQGATVVAAREKAREYLRQQQPFVGNVTNTNRMLRSQVIQLLADDHARIRIVYVENAWEELLRRNRSRAASVPLQAIERLAERLEVPDRTEAHQVEWVIG